MEDTNETNETKERVYPKFSELILRGLATEGFEEDRSQFLEIDGDRVRGCAAGAAVMGHSKEAALSLAARAPDIRNMVKGVLLKALGVESFDLPLKEARKIPFTTTYRYVETDLFDAVSAAHVNSVPATEIASQLAAVGR